MKISVVITVYNLEEFVSDAIQSVLEQSYKPYEILVIDDFSTDRSADIVRKFKDIRYIRMPKNSGVLSATLDGIKHANGDIITFLDGDDIWHTEKLAEILNVFQNEKDVIMITHNYEIINREGKLTGAIDLTKRNIKNITIDKPDKMELSRRIKNSILSYKGIWLGSAYCFRRSAFDLNAFENFIDSFDIPHFRKLCYQDHPIAHYIIHNNDRDKLIYLINKPLFYYRVFDNNSSGVSNTIDKAFNIINRGKINILCTRTMISEMSGLEKEKKRQDLLKLEYEYLELLYSKRLFKATRYFFILMFIKWKNTERIKEIKRILAVLLLGPAKFLSIKNENR